MNPYHEQMDLIPEAALRALRFVELINQNGASPSATQVDKFAANGGPMGALFSSRMFDVFAKLVAATASQMTREAETISKFIVRMEWAKESANGMSLTRVGSALLAGLLKESEATAESEAVPSTLVLEPDSPLSQIELAQATSQAGSGLFVDPHFQPLALPWLIASSSISRLLIKTPKVGIGAHSTALGYTKGSERLEVRATGSTLHDRAIVGDDRGVTLIGSSANGIGRHLTTLVRLSPADGASYRERLEELYQGAEVVEPLRLDGEQPS